MGKVSTIKNVDVSKLIPYINNAKQHSEDQITRIASSIREFGFLSPVLIDHEYNIIAGHGRVLAAKKLGLNDVPCVYVEGLSDAQRKAYILADNRLGELADWDMDLVTSELQMLLESDFDIDLTGFELPEDEPEEKNVVEDAAPEQVPGRCKLGDLWKLGDHRLICGDSTDPIVVDKLMGGFVADISITSPPYGAGRSSKLRDHYEKGAEHNESFYENYSDNSDEWYQLISGSFSNMVMHSTAQFINIQMLADNKRDLVKFVFDNIDTFCDVIVWDKAVAPPQMQDNILNNKFEFVFVFGNSTRTIPFGNFHGNQNNIFVQTTGHNEYSDIHRAVYPVEFPAKIMEIASKAGSVLDLFGGTGTTMIACEQLNRVCYMCELDPHYCDVIIQRWENLTGGKAELING